MFNRVKAYRIPGGQVYRPFMDMASNSHMVIAGCTGSGKSVTVNGIITTLLITQSPVNCQFVLIDPKKVELIQYSNLPHTIRYASEQPEIISALEMAVNETENRFRIMQRNREKEYTGSHLYVIIDELADIMTTVKKQAMPLIQRIAQLGRAARVHLIACTQSVLVQVLPSVIRCNIPVTVGLRCANAQQSRFLIQATGCELLPDPKSTGKGYAIIRDGADLYRIAIYKYSDSVVNSLIEYWNSKKCIA